MAAVDLKSLSFKQIRDVFNTFDNILCDNDGVLSCSGHLLPGALNCFEMLQELKKKIIVVTNNTAFGRKGLSAVLKNQGMIIQAGDIITPISPMINYLKEKNFKGKVWVMGFTSMAKEFEENGFNVTVSEKRRYDSLSEINKYLLTYDPEIKAIVIDISLDITVGCLNKTIEYLRRDPEIFLLFGSTDSTLPYVKSTLIGPAYTQNIVTKLSNKTPLVFGKPSENFEKYLIDTLKCQPARTLFIGDSLKHDINFAKKLGFSQLLVLTGNTKIIDLENCESEYKPYYYINSLLELEELLKCAL